MLLSTTDTSRTLDSKHPEIPLCCLFAPAGSVTVSVQIYQQHVQTLQLLSAASPLLLLGTLWQRLHAELQHVPTVLVPPKVPLQK